MRVLAIGIMYGLSAQSGQVIWSFDSGGSAKRRLHGIELDGGVTGGEIGNSGAAGAPFKVTFSPSPLSDARSVNHSPDRARGHGALA